MTARLDDRFAQTMAALEPPAAPMAVACSGGPDSMALALLAKRWAETQAIPLTALIVEHGLRDTSAGEAEQTRDRLARLGIACEILPVSVSPGSATQERARRARYEALINWCRAYGRPSLLLAHHADDQAETVVLRLLGGSRLPGLAGMPLRRERADIQLLRPLLGVRKTHLMAYLKAHAQPYIADPSNDNPDFTRVRVRRLLSSHPAAIPRLWHIAQRLGTYRRHIETWQQRWLLRHTVVYPYGVIHVANALMKLPDDVQCDLLSRLLMAVDGGEYPPRRAELERLVAALPEKRTESLHRCLIIAHGEGWLICREPAHTAPPAPLSDGVCWDRRFTLYTRAPADDSQGLHIAALGEAGWLQIKDRVALELPHPARLGLPAIWQLDAVVSLAHIWYDSNLSAATPVIIAFKPAKTLEESPFYAIPDSLIE